MKISMSDIEHMPSSARLLDLALGINSVILCNRHRSLDQWLFRWLP
jgi:hypothetical protein